MPTARVEAQAKINLFLHVLAREESGYHQVETLLCRIALSDAVTVRVPGAGRSLDVGGPMVPEAGLGPVEQNLAWRAAAAYATATGFPAGFEIAIEKRIPVGAGLGGGSADAGAVLRALNALNPSPMERAGLVHLAGSLGADVPFLTQDQSAMALAWGRGERLLLVPTLPASAVWLLVPDVAVSTADAYRWVDERPRSSSAVSVGLGELATWTDVARLARNDFEGVVGRRVPVVGRLLHTLRDETVQELLGSHPIVLMSGSGSTVFVVSGSRPPEGFAPLPEIDGVTMLETETSQFVEPVVLTH